MSESSTESDFSADSAPNEEDLKMQKLLKEWDERDAAKDDLYVDSDDEEGSDDDNSPEAEAKKRALLATKKEDESEEESEGEDEPATNNRSVVPSSKAQEVSEESDDEEEEESETNERALVVAKNQEESEEESSSGEEEESEEQDDEEESDEDEASEPRATKREVVDSDDEEEDEDEEEDDDEEEESEEEDEEDEPRAQQASEPVENGRSRKVADDDKSTVSVDTTDDGPIVDTLKKKPKKKKERRPKKITDPEECDDEEDLAMKELLANWDAENGKNDGDDDDDASDDSSEASEREVELNDGVIDHIVLAAPDLDDAIEEFKKMTGAEPVIAGTIKGLGIKCARISFTDSSYLEIIAPDPKGPGPIGELIKSKKIKELTPFHYAIRSRRAEAMKDEVVKYGYTPDHITMFGAKADGTPRKWEMLYLYGHKMGGICPFFINWANSDHPCATLPVVGKLKKFSIRAPQDDPVHKLLQDVNVDNIRIEEGDPKISFSFQSPEGTIKFSSHKAVGFKFPGFEADVGAIPGDDGSQDAEVVFDEPEQPELLPVEDDVEEIPEAAY